MCVFFLSDDNKFGFKTGRTYFYKYESDINTQIQGASEDHAALQLTADVDLEVLSKCELSLKVNIIFGFYVCSFFKFR